MPRDLAGRADSLQVELEKAIQHYRRRARTSYQTAVLLMVFTVGASAAAGLGGLLFGWPPKIVGGVALLPGILSLAATALKPQERANWYYQKKAALNTLRRRLEYGIGEAPSYEDIKTVSEDWSNLDRTMENDWEHNLALNWSPFAKSSQGTNPQS
jgi:hypothetical protein